MVTHVNEWGDVVCEHGTAVDVHCCGCHSGFLFDRGLCRCDAIDLSPYVQSVTVHHEPAEREPTIVGLRSMAPIRIEGTWDDGGYTCHICGARFAAGPEGLPTLHHPETGAVAIACPPCVMALVTWDDDA